MNTQSPLSSSDTLEMKRSVVWNNKFLARTDQEKQYAEKLQRYGSLAITNSHGVEREGPHYLSLIPTENGLKLEIRGSKEGDVLTSVSLPKNLFDNKGLNEVVGYYQRQKTLSPQEKDPAIDPAEVLESFCKRCEAPLAKALSEARVADKGLTAHYLAALAYFSFEHSLSLANLGSHTGRNR